ncbi:MAG: hypothetical protein ACQSGP_04055, partial [Frankia sp.]
TIDPLTGGWVPPARAARTPAPTARAALPPASAPRPPDAPDLGQSATTALPAVVADERAPGARGVDGAAAVAPRQAVDRGVDSRASIADAWGRPRVESFPAAAPAGGSSGPRPPAARAPPPSGAATQAVVRADPPRATPDPDLDEDDDDGWRPSSTVRGRGPGRRGAGRAVAASGSTRRRPEPELVDEDDFDDDEEFDEDDFDDDQPRARRGWLAPILVAVVLSVVAIGLYLVFVKGGGSSTGGGAAPTSTVTGSPATLTKATPTALAGKAMMPGSYRCFSATTSTKMVALKDHLIVSRTVGSYTWNGVAGTYTINRKAYSIKTQVFSDVTFTSGPLHSPIAESFMVDLGAGDGGGDSGLLTFRDGTSRFCEIT